MNEIKLSHQKRELHKPVVGFYRISTCMFSPYYKHLSLLSFPLGLGYFIFLITGIVLGVGTLIIWIGVPILILMMSAWWQLAVFERHMAMRWLGIAIPPMGSSLQLRITRWQSIPTHLTNSMTWKTLAYLLAKFLIGIFSFVITITLSSFMLAITIISCIIGLLTAPFVLLFGKDRSFNVWRYLLFACSGFGLSIITLHVFNSMAFASGQFARVMLGMSDSAMRLQEARTIAEQSRIRAEQPDAHHLALIVADNGIGISADDLAHIFERFYRADTSRTRTSGGFGLGLAIVHDLVTAMGGTISVQSEAGKGSRFCVVLRVASSTI